MATFSIDEHLEDLTRHIDLVRQNCLLLGKRLIKSGRKEFGLILIKRGFQHDITKFEGIEWNFLHTGPDAPKTKVALAIEQHVSTNDHHPEFWGGINMMPEIAIAEMICDCFARSQEFGTDFRNWLENDAAKKYNIDKRWKQWQWMCEFTDMLLQNSFIKKEGDE